MNSGLKDNYYALLLCIIRPFTIDKSLAQFGLIKRKTAKRHKLSHEDNLKMVELRNQGLSYMQIGEIYDIGACAVEHRIRRVLNGK